MNRKLLTTVSATALVLGAMATAPAKADVFESLLSDNAYVSIFGGVAFSESHSDYYYDVYENRLKTGFTVGGVIGNYVGPGLRFERELSFIRNKNKDTRFDATGPRDPLSGETDAIFFLGNLWKDINTGSMITPYIGAGVGTAIIGINNSAFNGNNTWDDYGIAFAGQLGAGVRIGINDRMAVDAGYRFKAAVDATLERSGDLNSDSVLNFYSHVAQIGLTYALGDGQVMPPAENTANWYVSVFGGAAFAENTHFDYFSTYSFDHKTGFTVGGAVGTHLAPDLRGELEVSYVRQAMNNYTTFGGQAPIDASGDVDEVYVLANLWKDFHLGMLSPYIGAGIGVGVVRFDDVITNAGTFPIGDNASVGLAGQFGAGVRVDVLDNLKVDLGYRFKSIVNVLIEGYPPGTGFDDNASVAVYNHILQGGVTYDMGGGSAGEDFDPGTGSTWYASVFGGGVFPLDTHVSYNGSNYMVDFKTGFTVGAAVGTNVLDTVRGELEVSYVNADVKDSQPNDAPVQPASGDVDTVYLLANLWKDLPMGMFTPYAGFGIGMAFTDVDIDLCAGGCRIDDSSIVLAGQAGAGVRFDVLDTAFVDVGYRFKATLDVLTEGSSATASSHGSASYYSHIVQAGVGMKF